MGTPEFLPPHITLTSMTIPEETSFEGWAAAAAQVKCYEHGWQWWLADLLLWAERHGMDTQAVQALHELQFEDHTLVNKRYVASRFAPERRRRELSFAHHADVASLEPTEADTLLESAVVGRWTRSQLRDAMDAAQRQNEDKPKRRKKKKEPEQNGNDVAVAAGDVSGGADNRPVDRIVGGESTSAREKTEPADVAIAERELALFCQTAVDSAIGFTKLVQDPRATPDRIYMSARQVREAVERVIDACERAGHATALGERHG